MDGHKQDLIIVNLLENWWFDYIQKSQKESMGIMGKATTVTVRLRRRHGAYIFMAPT